MRLGENCFPKGYYVYVSPALRGVKGRAARCLNRVKRLHWHIDYLLASERSRIVSVAIRGG
ncbi:MAG: DUF123 domain-containing protein [Candidatus Bathyarchaeia archaeon]